MIRGCNLPTPRLERQRKEQKNTKNKKQNKPNQKDKKTKRQKVKTNQKWKFSQEFIHRTFYVNKSKFLIVKALF